MFVNLKIRLCYLFIGFFLLFGKNGKLTHIPGMSAKMVKYIHFNAWVTLSSVSELRHRCKRKKMMHHLFDVVIIIMIIIISFFINCIVIAF